MQIKVHTTRYDPLPSKKKKTMVIPVNFRRKENNARAFSHRNTKELVKSWLITCIPEVVSTLAPVVPLASIIITTWLSPFSRQTGETEALPSFGFISRARHTPRRLSAVVLFERQRQWRSPIIQSPKPSTQSSSIALIACPPWRKLPVMTWITWLPTATIAAEFMKQKFPSVEPNFN